jgi:hypothetical protein
MAATGPRKKWRRLNESTIDSKFSVENLTLLNHRKQVAATGLAAAVTSGSLERHRSTSRSSRKRVAPSLMSHGTAEEEERNLISEQDVEPMAEDKLRFAQEYASSAKISTVEEAPSSSTRNSSIAF